MARSLGETTITVSVLDRLIDLEPGNRMENPLSRSQSVRLLKNAVRRDLEWLLNTRRICDPPDEGLKELNRSAYTYGLPDLSSLTMAASGDRNKLVRQILATINLFEPRLANVRLVVVETPDSAKKDVRLRVEAMLRMDPVPEPISFDTVIELKSGNCRLTGGDDAR
ncbi:MAG TPA: type VI secretion system baseplate subunit TssE [Terracidiphilus sp.]|jgi:type VI secretion system protein ImpF|nr:type VI secretion system baseplate subunit TssE [Terracidiphilus sp.]